MGSYIEEHRKELEKRHYVTTAKKEGYYYNFYYKMLEEKYQARYGDNFCLIINGSDTVEDAYIIPYTAVKSLFVHENLVNGKRWRGHIRNQRLDVGNKDKSISVAAYYNMLDNLIVNDIQGTNINSAVFTPEIASLIAAEESAVIAMDTFDINNIVDGRKRIAASIVSRRGQPKLRKMLLENYDGKCAITGCGVQEVLEVAHIVPYKGPDTDHPSNGLLLRADTHTLFDLGLLAIDTADMTVILAPNLTDTAYGELSGKLLRPPKVSHPSKEALDWHRAWAESQWQPNTNRRLRR